jgi:hypothetical protein
VSKKSGATQPRPQARPQGKSQGPNQNRQARPMNGHSNGASHNVVPASRPLVDATQVKANEEARRQARMERQAANREAAAKRKRMLMVRNIGIGAAALMVVVAIAAYFIISEANKPGQFVPMQPSPHLTSETEAHAPYSTTPPTSGPHVPTVPQWGVHTEPLSNELLVHGLEDAGVEISYQPNIDKATLDKLTALVNGYDKEVLLAPYNGLSNPIVLTAWTRIERLDKFDEASIQKFIQAYKGIDHHKDSGS